MHIMINNNEINVMLKNNNIPKPTKMPDNATIREGKLNLVNFINSYYVYRDMENLGNVKSILIIGPGQGLDTAILKWKGYEVTTLDIDDAFLPDIIGSVHDLNMFKNTQFDVVIASHVLEHLAVAYLDKSLEELSRVAKYAIVYLPVHGRHFQGRLKMDIKGIDLSCIFDLFNYFHKPDGVTPRYCQGQHFWEIGMRGFRVKDLKNRFSQYFEVINDYRNKDWVPSYNFVMRSR